MNYCRSCGVSIPENQILCSLCYGDPYYGQDGYYLDYLNEILERVESWAEYDEEYEKDYGDYED